MRIALSADYDSDGDVDGADFLAVQRALGARDSQADFNDDGIVNGADALLLRIEFGQSLPPGVSNTTTVPEPAAGVLFATLLAIGFKRIGTYLGAV